MIRINLLAVERSRAKHKVSCLVAQKMPIICSLVLLMAVVIVG